MPRRATKRGVERTRLDRDCDVLICGASFAGLAVARELRSSGAHVLILDRYEIGERPTSACGIPTPWLQALGLMAAQRQEFPEVVIHTPFGTARYRLPWTFSTFDYGMLCAELAAQGEFEFDTATVLGRDSADAARGTASPRAAARTAPGDAARPIEIQTDRGSVRAPLVVDAMGWRRVLGAGAPIQPPEACLSRGLEVHPPGTGDELEVWIDRAYVPAGYAWSFPASAELRIGVGSFDPRFHVREPTVRLAADLGREAIRYQGNWIPHRLREAVEDGAFFAGDSAGHCLPLTAEGIRTALYFGIACGRELRAVVTGQRSRAAALARYAAFSAAHRWKFETLLRVQRLIPRVPPPLLGGALRAMQSKRFVDWAFGHYLAIAHPDFARADALPRLAAEAALNAA